MTTFKTDYGRLPDTDLLVRIVTGKDEQAFGEVVRRHGPMVRATLRRALCDTHDVDDAFQATFMAFAMSCHRIRKKSSLPAWLYETARRSARALLRQRSRWDRGKRVELTGEEMQPTKTPDGELRAELDLALERLPEIHRAAIILCDLEGLSRAQAAARLGIPVTTLKSRLAKGRDLLKSKLVKNGVTLGVGFLLGQACKEAVALEPQQVEHVNRFADLAASPSKTTTCSAQIVEIATGVKNTMILLQLIRSTLTFSSLATGIACFALIVGGFMRTAPAKTILFDDFNDGNYADGSPATWTLLSGFPGTLDASSGDLVMAPTETNATFVAAWPVAATIDVRDVSVRARIRSDSDNEGIGLFVRADPTVPTGYQGGIESNGLMYINENHPTGGVLLGTLPTSLDSTAGDLFLQFDAIGDELSLYAWQVGMPRPSEPQLRVPIGTLPQTSGSVGVSYVPVAAGRGTATFRFVHVADSSIPEPSSAALAVLCLGCVVTRRALRV
ncbi:MAG: RNA polymerase sigma factor [Planctomycetales bacterium]|nr:RNA polymerase sigma factor [Planctomycetales bacterium]